MLNHRVCYISKLRPPYIEGQTPSFHYSNRLNTIVYIKATMLFACLVLKGVSTIPDDILLFLLLSEKESDYRLLGVGVLIILFANSVVKTCLLVGRFGISVAKAEFQKNGLAKVLQCFFFTYSLGWLKLLAMLYRVSDSVVLIYHY